MHFPYSKEQPGSGSLSPKGAYFDWDGFGNSHPRGKGVLYGLMLFDEISPEQEQEISHAHNDLVNKIKSEGKDLVRSAP